MVEYTDKDKQRWREVKTLKVESEFAKGGFFEVSCLTEEEAKAKISAEYGFEYNAIKIVEPCWYEATDMNYFKFRVMGNTYIVNNYEHLEIVYD